MPRGNPVEEILEEAQREDGTLIVMATHERSSLGRMLLGSVTDAVVRRTNASALVVTPPSPGATFVSPSSLAVANEREASATGDQMGATAAVAWEEHP
jgi:hypothetical protein